MRRLKRSHARLILFLGGVLMVAFIFVSRPIDRPTAPPTFRAKQKQKWVISYTLYGGENNRYVVPLKRVVSELAPVLFPEWAVRIYHDDSISASLLEFFISHGAETMLGPDDVPNKMTWRFLPASDASVDRFISRDADSYLTLREKWAVDEWIESGKRFHNMRDHPSGSRYTIMGGMWGCTRDAFPEMHSLLKTHARDPSYMVDMDVLNAHFWNVLRRDAIQHDSFSCDDDRFGRGVPFPFPRIGEEIVGAVVIDSIGTTREDDREVLRNARSPPQCVKSATPLVRANFEKELRNVFVDSNNAVFDQTRLYIGRDDTKSVFHRNIQGDEFMKRTRFLKTMVYGNFTPSYLVFVGTLSFHTPNAI